MPRPHYRLFGFIGILAGGITAAAITHDNIHGGWLVLWPAGLILGLLVARMWAHRGGYRAGVRVEQWRAAAANLRLTDPETYEQILAQSQSDPQAAAAAARDPDAYVAIFMSFADQEDVLELVPRDDRHADRRVFEGVTGDRLRTALTRACTAAGVPAFSPHDLRHRRVTLLHLAGMPWARIGELVGHDDVMTTARTYTHVVADETELDYAPLLTC